MNSDCIDYTSRKGSSRIRDYFEKTHGVKLSKDQILRHSCDNPRCRNILHISIGTLKDNSLDCLTRGRHRARGKNLLNPEVIREIRKTSKISISEWAKRLNRSYNCIYFIKIGKTYAWVE